MCEFMFGENKHWESKNEEIESQCKEGILFDVLQMLSYFKTPFKRSNSRVVLLKWTGK